MLKSGKVLRADVCVIGAGDSGPLLDGSLSSCVARISADSSPKQVLKLLLAPPAGSVPATGFLKQSGIHMDSRGFITVNKVSEKVHEVNVNSHCGKTALV